MELKNETKKQIRRVWRNISWTISFLIITALECLVFLTLINMTKESEFPPLQELPYVIIIPIVFGFAVIIAVIGRKLKPDLYDQYIITSSVSLKNEAQKLIELYNQWEGAGEKPEYLKIEKMDKK